MKKHKIHRHGKSHSHRATRTSHARMKTFAPAETDRWGDLESVERAKQPDEYTAMETGQPDRDVPHTRGPLGEEGQGDRQNDQLAELEEIEPEEK